MLVNGNSILFPTNKQMGPLVLYPLREFRVALGPCARSTPIVTVHELATDRLVPVISAIEAYEVRPAIGSIETDAKQELIAPAELPEALLNAMPKFVRL